ncbi:MAG: hypothetical protein NTY31_02990 [Candidatus Falkowbacteria bacterium]|nr:hypothetical protein [Candidatus Falkowbacteria bacterium]
MPESEIKPERQLKEAIIKVLVFFDLFDHPLTAYEIWMKLDKKWGLTEILDFLDKEILKPAAALSQRSGFYFLVGREEITTIRQRRYNYSAEKMKIARRFARIFSLLPFVRMVALANSLGQYNSRAESDIDFFIVSAPHRVWLARLYCTGLAKLLNRRPNATDKKDKICLSFYVAADRLCLDDLRLQGEDPYFDYWRRSLVLLYNKDKTYERFLEVNELSFGSVAVGAAISPKPNIFLDKLEILAKRFQLAIMPAELKSSMNNSDGVVINDSILKLYRRDRRREYAEKYGNKINEILKEDN